MNINEYEVSRKIYYTEFINNGKRFLLSNYPYLDIVFNDHCNAKCKFCISHLIHKKEKCDIYKQMPKIDYAIERMGVKEVLLLGGEPTINDDIFIILDHLKRYRLNKICLTTNGHRMAKDLNYAKKLLSSGITHVNISYMTADKEKQTYISGSPCYVSLENLWQFKALADDNNVHLRINNNVFAGNNDSLISLLNFYWSVSNKCHSVKFSPLLKTDSFSTVNEVTEFNAKNILPDAGYDNLWEQVENHFGNYPILRNTETFGFVEYSMVIMPTPIILNYNQHGKLREKVIKEGKINNLKLLATGDLSLSWNRDETDWFINTEVL